MNKKLRKNCIIRYLNKYRSGWDLFIIILVCYNIITLPLLIAFQVESLDSDFAQVVNSTLDFFFFIDILIDFRTTYVDAYSGIEVLEGKQIAKNYLKGRFLIDLLSTIPFDVLSH